MSEKISSKNEDRLLELASKIVSGYVGHNPMSAAKLPGLIQTVYRTLQEISEMQSIRATTQKPAVSAEKSVTDDYLVCLEDGKRLKMLKRHLRSKFGLTPDQYRARWNLPKDYPMVAPGYAERRSKLAREIGLGRKSD